MPQLALIAVDRPELAPYPLSERLRSQLVYFMSPPGAPGVPTLGENEYWADAADVATVLNDGVISLVSPLDTANMTEVEISEEQEALLGWLHKNKVQHTRVVG